MTNKTIDSKLHDLDKRYPSFDLSDFKHEGLFQFSIESLTTEDGGVYAALENIVPRSEFYRIEYSDAMAIEPTVLSSICQIRHRLKSESTSTNSEYSFDQLVMMEIVSERVHLDIDRASISQRMSPSSKTLATTRFLSLVFDLTTDGTESLGYSDRKAMEEFKNLDALNNHGELIQLFGHSVHAIDMAVHHVRTLATTYWRYFPESFVLEISRFSKVQQLYYLNALRREEMLDFITIYQEKNWLPLAFCIHELSFPNQRNKTIAQYCLDGNYVRTLALGISKLRRDSNKSFKDLSESLRLSHSNLWHCGFLLSMVKDRSIDPTYSQSVDFNSDMGLHSAHMLMTICDDDDRDCIEELANNVYKSFLSQCEVGDNYPPYFLYTSFRDYLFYSIQTTYKDDKESFSQELERLAIDTQRKLFSWKPSSCTGPFTQLVYMIVAWRSSLFHTMDAVEKLPETTKLLSSKRIGKIFDFEKESPSSFFSVLKELLTSQEEEISFQLPKQFSPPIGLTWRKG